MGAAGVTASCARLPELADVNSDQQDRGLAATLDDRPRHGVADGNLAQAIDNTLYDAFGQRQVSVMYTQLNQYHVVMEVAPRFWQNPDGLKYLYVRGTNGQQVPLSAFTQYVPSNTALSVNHQGQFPSVTISFNLPVGMSLSQAVPVIEEAEREIGLPVQRARQLPGHRAGVSGLAVERADPDRGRAGHGLHRAGHAV